MTYLFPHPGRSVTKGEINELTGFLCKLEGLHEDMFHSPTAAWDASFITIHLRFSDFMTLIKKAKQTRNVEK